MTNEVARYAFIGCGKSKKDGVHPARELYDSNYAHLKRDYAERYCEGYSILSAKHGPVAPTEWIESYNTTLRDAGDSEMETYRDRVYEMLSWNERNDVWLGYDQVVVLAGSAYIEPIRPLLDELEACIPELTVHYPFEDTNGIGEQMAWLRAKIDEYDGEPDIPEPSTRSKQAGLTAFADGGGER